MEQDKNTMLESIGSIIAKEDERRKTDAIRYEELDGDLCQLCHAYGADKRSLYISCFYSIHEVIPEIIDLSMCDGVPDNGYYLRLCKSCRGRLLDMLEKWRNECVGLRNKPKDHDGSIEEQDENANIPLRVNGRIVMVTEEEFYAEKENNSRQASELQE